MKILHTTFSIDPKMGGTTKVCMEIAVAMANRGHSVSIFSTDYLYDPADKASFQIQGLNIPENLQIKLFPVKIFARGLAFSWQMLVAMKKEIASYDIIHTHSLYLFHCLLSGYFCEKFKVPHIIMPHGSLDPFLYQRKRLRKWFIESFFQNRILAQASAINFTTTEEMELAKPYTFGAPGIIIPNGLHLDEYANLPDKGHFRSKYPETIGKKLILFFSRINFKKGLDILIPAFIKLARQHPDYHLALVGPDDSNLVPGILQQLKQAGIETDGENKRVTITGMLSGQDKLAVLNDADVFVLPSYSENFGIAVIEAMLCGLPVIISDKVNIWREVVADGAGIAGPGNADWFAENIEAILQDPQKCKSMGQAGIESVKKRYSWDQIASQLEKEYTSIIHNYRHLRT